MKYYAGIGSRQTPDEIQDIMQRLAYKLASQGWTLRSGGADGADMAFYRGLASYTKTVGVENTHHLGEIFLPWEGFNDINSNHASKHYYVASQEPDYYKKALGIAEETHPAWEKLSRGARALHTRNVYQCLGFGLDKPVKFVICYAETTKNGSVKGGTRTAVEIAKKNGATIYNLYIKEDLNRMLKFL